MKKGQIVKLISTVYNQWSIQTSGYKRCAKDPENTQSSYPIFAWIRDSTLTLRIVQKGIFKLKFYDALSHIRQENEVKKIVR